MTFNRRKHRILDIQAGNCSDAVARLFLWGFLGLFCRFINLNDYLCTSNVYVQTEKERHITGCHT